MCRSSRRASVVIRGGDWIVSVMYAVLAQERELGVNPV